VSHKFKAGDFVEYQPAGSKRALFQVLRLMPNEFQAFDWKYRIKSEHETFERSVNECDLSPSIAPSETYEPLPPLRRSSRA
jgi:hypothetical protein